jgi:cation-transporting ATPase 13A2
MVAAARGEDVELADLVSQEQRRSSSNGASAAHPHDAAVWTFFSAQERERLASGQRRRAGAVMAVHTPCGAGAEQALEVSVLALCGRAPSQPRRVAFGCAATLCALVCAAASWLYPRDPEFTLTPAQQGLGFAGVFLVLQSACLLACMWYPGTFCRCTTAPCALAEARTVLVFCEDGSEHIVLVDAKPGLHSQEACRCLTFRHVRFLYEAGVDAFVVENMRDPLADAAAQGLTLTEGLSEPDADARKAWYGVNVIDVPMPSIPRQLADEVLNPFCFFQFFSCVQWTLQLYWHYALIVLFITLAAAAISLVISRQNFRRLRDLSRHDALVSVRRGGGERRVLSAELVPGDVFCVEESMSLPCDAVLVAGECLVSEAMLTGESVPVAKTAATPGAVPAKACLFGGTSVLQMRSLGGGPVLARCTRTGFSTEKGRLIRSILFPRAGRLDLTRDGNRFVAFVLLPMAVAGGIASCVHALQQGDPFTVASALDLVSIAVPPALPAAMMIGVATAVDRLRRRNIFCIAPNRVNMAGRIARACFDKTGTLTYDGLTMLGVRPLQPDGSKPAAFSDEVPAEAVPAACAVDAAAAPMERLALVMGACQSLRHLVTPHGQQSLVGDPLEVVMLQSSGWQLSAGADGAVRVRAPSGALCATQLQVFDFSSELARMAVVVQLSAPTSGGAVPDSARVLVKGSPEAVAAMCAPATVPADFFAMLAAYAGGGYRVIGCAERVLGAGQAAAAAAGSLTRADAEGSGELRFVGLVALENKLKPSSASVIAALQAADIGVCMITGDHARTAVTVAKACNILARDAAVVLCDAAPGGAAPTYTRLAQTPQEADAPLEAAAALGVECEGARFVATGAGFDALLAAAEQGAPAALSCLVGRLSVAARFQPAQKSGLVSLFIERGDFTAFVGDGANDSAALKAADVGLSLTADAEASVAAPFTSKDADIASCITLLLEGRAALATSFQLFKFMALYACVQFSTSLQMNLANTYLSEYEFLWVDLLGAAHTRLCVCTTSVC